jgi:hypothetical protein
VATGRVRPMRPTYAPEARRTYAPEPRWIDAADLCQINCKGSRPSCPQQGAAQHAQHTAQHAQHGAMYAERGAQHAQRATQHACATCGAACATCGATCGARKGCRECFGRGHLFWSLTVVLCAGLMRRIYIYIYIYICIYTHEREIGA